MKSFHPFRRSAPAVAVASVLASLSVAAPPQAPEAMASCPSVQVLDHVLRLCDEAEKRMPMAILAGETIAGRHLKGGAIGAWWENDCLGPELYGRSGNIVHIGYDRVWKKDRTDSEKMQDVALIGMEWPPPIPPSARRSNGCALARLPIVRPWKFRLRPPGRR